MIYSEFRRDEQIIGEDYVSAGQLGTISRLEPLYGFRRGMRGVSGFIFEDKEMHKAGRIVFFLPRQIHSRAWFIRFDVRHEFLDGPLDLVDSRRPDLILSDGINCHSAGSS